MSSRQSLQHRVRWFWVVLSMWLLSCGDSKSLPVASAIAVAVIAVACVIFQRSTTDTNLTFYCHNHDQDTRVEFEYNPRFAAATASLPTSQPFKLKIDPCLVFSDTYIEARKRFREAVVKIPKAELHVLPIVDDDNIHMTMDIAILPGSTNITANNNHGWLVHSSGLHGVEGYAGSAIQLSYLQYRHQILANHHPDSHGDQELVFPTVVLVHVINPFGMHHYRRVNENNVDLNRNALNETGWQEATARRHKTLTMYDELDPFIFNPAQPPTLWFYYVGYWFRALVALWRYGFLNIKRAMVAAQYHQPNGIFFGGNAVVEPSLRVLMEFLEKHGITNSSSQYDKNDSDKSSSSITSCMRRCTWIDVHTGLGNSGDDTLFFTSRHNRSTALQKQIARSFDGSQFASTTASATTNTSASSIAAEQAAAGYDLSIGFLTDYVYDLWTTTNIDGRSNHSDADASAGTTHQQPSVLTFVQEFGTVNPLLVSRGLVLEHMAWRNFRDDNRKSPSKTLDPHLNHHKQWAQRTTRAVFYPDSATWRSKVLQNGLRVMFQAHARHIPTENDFDSSKQTDRK